MFEQISTFFTTEMIYLWLNIGILPFWFVLLFFPSSKISRYFVTSIIPYLILSCVYIYLIKYYYVSEINFLGNFNLYLGFNELFKLFEEEAFLILFWIHFLAINLFCGCWIVRESQKFGISKVITFIPLLLTYFIGPVGLLLFWIIKIFFAKKISLYE